MCSYVNVYTLRVNVFKYKHWAVFMTKKLILQRRSNQTKLLHAGHSYPFLGLITCFKFFAKKQRVSLTKVYFLACHTQASHFYKVDSLRPE